jgi:hypothetical protein
MEYCNAKIDVGCFSGISMVAVPGFVRIMIRLIRLKIPKNFGYAEFHTSLRCACDHCFQLTWLDLYFPRINDRNCYVGDTFVHLPVHV